IPVPLISRRPRKLQFQARLRGQPEQLLAHGTLRMPLARIPLFSADVVAAVKQLREQDAAKLRDREERGRFHLDRQTSLAPPSLDLRSGLAIDTVGSPRLADEVLNIARLESSFQRGHS